MYATPSPKGVEFTKDHEGFVTRTYKDQGGVLTIGFGFTNGSPICRAWFVANYGHPLRMGDKMTLAQGMALLDQVLAREVGPAVVSLQPQEQYEFDGAADMLYNCGNGAAKWGWAMALKARQVARCANLLLTTAVTAQGVPSQGLRKRRRDEAGLIKDGVYTPAGAVPAAISTDPEDIKTHQKQLAALQYYKGPIDGQPNDLYIGAVKNFQRAAGLVVDGGVGPATRAALIRATTGKNGVQWSAGSGIGAGGLGSLGLHLDNPWVVVALAVAVLLTIYLAFVLWQHRGVLMGGKRTPA